MVFVLFIWGGGFVARACVFFGFQPRGGGAGRPPAPLWAECTGIQEFGVEGGDRRRQRVPRKRRLGDPTRPAAHLGACFRRVQQRRRRRGEGIWLRRRHRADVFVYYNRGQVARLIRHNRPARRQVIAKPLRKTRLVDGAGRIGQHAEVARREDGRQLAVRHDPTMMVEARQPGGVQFAAQRLQT